MSRSVLLVSFLVAVQAACPPARWSCAYPPPKDLPCCSLDGTPTADAQACASGLDARRLGCCSFSDSVVFTCLDDAAPLPPAIHCTGNPAIDLLLNTVNMPVLTFMYRTNTYSWSIFCETLRRFNSMPNSLQIDLGSSAPRGIVNLIAFFAHTMWETTYDFPFQFCDEPKVVARATASCTQRSDNFPYANFIGTPRCARITTITQVSSFPTNLGVLDCSPGTVTEGCCWWGRGALQVTGPYRFQATQNDYVRHSNLSATVNLCNNPGAMCQFDDLKWAGALQQWAAEIQSNPCFSATLDAFLASGFGGSATTSCDSGFFNGTGSALIQGDWNIPNADAAQRLAHFRYLLKEFEFAGLTPTGLIQPPESSFCASAGTLSAMAITPFGSIKGSAFGVGSAHYGIAFNSTSRLFAQTKCTSGSWFVNGVRWVVPNSTTFKWFLVGPIASSTLELTAHELNCEILAIFIGPSLSALTSGRRTLECAVTPSPTPSLTISISKSESASRSASMPPTSPSRTASVTVSPSVASSPAFVIITNANQNDPSTAISGDWIAVDSPLGYGGDYLLTGSTGAVVIHTNLPASGEYSVYIWYVSDASRASQVPIRVETSSGPITEIIDMTQQATSWVLLGTYQLNEFAQVSIFSPGAPAGTVVADAILFAPNSGIHVSSSPSPSREIPETKETKKSNGSTLKIVAILVTIGVVLVLVVGLVVREVTLRSAKARDTRSHVKRPSTSGHDKLAPAQLLTSIVVPRTNQPKKTPGKGGLLPSLLQNVLTDPDMQRVETFLLTYKKFGIEQTLLEVLANTFASSTQPTQQTRVLHLIQLWIQTIPRDFSADFVGALQEFLQTVPSTFEVPLTSINKLLSSLPKRQLLDADLPTVKSLADQDIFGYMPKDLASEMSRRTIYLIGEIQFSELLDRSWESEDAAILAPGVIAATQNFNTICSWVQAQVLRERSPGRRAAAISYFVKLATVCLEEFNNLCDCKAIVLGLTSKSIARLKMTRNLVGVREKRSIKTLSELLSSKDNFESMRAYVNSRQGCIPYLGMVLSDLAKVEESIDYENDQLTFEKLSRLAELMKTLLNVPKKYPIRLARQDRLALMFQSLVFVATEDLLLLSSEREP